MSDAVILMSTGAVPVYVAGGPGGTGPAGPAGTIAISGVAWVTPQQYGAVADGVTDDYPAFAAAIAYLKTIAGNDDVIYKGSPKLFIPAADEYYLSDTLDITHTLIIEGEASNSGMASRLRFADNKTGIRIQGHNTSGGSTVDGANHYSGASSIIRNIALVGGSFGTEAAFTGAEGEFHGIHLRAAATIEDVYINGFRGDGIHIQTSIGGGGADEGNANCTHIVRPRCTNVRCGIYIDGADANACTIIGLNATYCRRWGVYDSSFLGNTHIGHHSANAGLVPGVPSTIVSHSGNRYAVVAGQAAGASTNAPSGTTANNTWWIYLHAGAANSSLNIPAWSNGVSVREGGSYHTDSANGYNQFIGCYSEGGEAPAQFIAPTLVIGGLWGTTLPVMTGIRYAGNILDAGTNLAYLGPTIASATTGLGLVIRNSQTLTAGYESKLRFAVGADDADGTELAELVAVASSATPNNNEPNVILRTRAYSTGVLTDRLVFGGIALAFHPDVTNQIELGASTRLWKKVWATDAAFTNMPTVGGVPIVGGINIQSVTSAATVTPTFSNDQVNITAQAAALNLANPTGTAADAHGIVIRIKDNGTARAITYGSQYRAIGVILPTTTVISKTLYLGMVFNAADTKWDVVSVAQEA